MKRICITITILSLFVSCSETDITPPPKVESGFPYTESDDGYLPYNAQSAVAQFKYRNGYLYFCGDNAYAIPTLGDGDSKDYIRMNLKTGNVTSFCPDPLCKHDTLDCPTYGIGIVQFLSPAGDLYFQQQYFYNDKDNSYFSSKFVKYNPETDKSSVLEDFENGAAGFGNEIYTDDYRFYHGMFYDANQDEYVPSIMRMNLSDGKTAPFLAGEVNQAGNAYTNDFLFTIDDRLYLTDAQTLYSVDFDGENRIDHIDGYVYGSGKTDGEYVYYTAAGEICRRSLDGGDEEKLGITPLQNYVLTENYIYYTSGDPVTLGKAQIYGYNSDTVTLEGGEFWRCRHDGSENELVYTFSGDTESYRPRDWIVVGNYIYAHYYWWTDADGDGIFEEGDDHESYPVNGSTLHRILRIDVTTGEEYFIEIAE